MKISIYASSGHKKSELRKLQKREKDRRFSLIWVVEISEEAERREKSDSTAS
jgi:hypothetical protein